MENRRGRRETKRFDYFLNAIFYCMWRKEITFSNVMKFIALGVIYLIEFILPRELRLKVKERRINAELELHDVFHNKKKGLNIVIAKDHFEFVTFSYVFLPISMIYGCIIKWVGFNFFVIVTIMIIGFILSSKFFNNRVFKKDVYLKYFKRFDKKDYKWYRKWRLIAFLFVVMSIPIFIAGIFFIIMMSFHFGVKMGYMPPSRFSK